MRNRRIIFTLVIGFLLSYRLLSQDPIQPIGEWREHLPYHSAIDVDGDDKIIYCATPYSLFSVDLSENSISRISRLNGLTETGVAAINYNSVSGKLLIGYKNSNVDILYRNDVINIPDIKIDNIVGDKAIYNIYASGKYFYLSTGLGVIVIDADKYEVKDSWFIGGSGGQVKVNGFTTDNSFYYAATDEGLKRTSQNTIDPANYLNWSVLSGSNNLSSGACENVVTVKNEIYVLKNDSVFKFNRNNWALFYDDPGWKIKNLNGSGSKIIINEKKNDGDAKIVSLNADGTQSRLLQQQNLIANPEKAILINNNYWVGDSSGGLTKFMSVGFENYNLNSPQSIATGQLVFGHSNLYAAAGTVDINWQGQNNKDGLYQFSNGEWTNYNYRLNASLDSVHDIISIAIDPVDESIWAGSFGDGLLHIKQANNIEIFKQNSFINPPTTDPNSYRVAGLSFDNDKNLWISNYGSAQSIVVRKTDGSTKAFSSPFSLNQFAVSQIIVDGENQKWIVSPLGNGLLCFNDRNTIDNSNDDSWKLYRAGSGIGNLPSNNVLCIAKDKNGFIWIGTDDGIGVIQCPQNVFAAGSCEAVLPVVTQGGFNQFLFKGEQVRSIAVDGADRKWVATKNGVWLVSAEGDHVIFRFTETNSPLLSNDVKEIAVNGKTGEVFFATANGICSYRSTATEGSGKNENVLVFPNPVPPGYKGIIAIRGVANNAIVKITELDGRLVYQTRALGGLAVWDGKDYKGRQISTGIYLVLVSDDGRKENLATKIIFVNK